MRVNLSLFSEFLSNCNAATQRIVLKIKFGRCGQSLYLGKEAEKLKIFYKTFGGLDFFLYLCNCNEYTTRNV